MPLFDLSELTRLLTGASNTVKNAFRTALGLGGGDVSIDTSAYDGTGNLVAGDDSVQDVADKFNAFDPEMQTEENRFVRLAIDTQPTTNIRFIVAGQGGRPLITQFPQRDGTAWLIDYRQVSGRLIVFDSDTPTQNFEINLQDLIAIRNEEIGTDLDGSLFLFANKSTRTGVFTANPAIAEVFPAAGVTLAPGSLAMLTLNSVGPNGPAQTYELIVQPLGGDPDTETLYGSGAPAATLGVVGDSYVRTSSGEEYKKTGTTTWIRQIDNATQAELDAVQAEVDAVEVEVDTVQAEVDTLETEVGALETRVNSIQSGAGDSGFTPRRSDHLSARGPIHDLVVLTQDTESPLDDHEFRFYPREVGNFIGVSRVDGLADGNLGGREASRDVSLATANWNDIVAHTDYIWGLDDTNNSLVAHRLLGLGAYGERVSSRDKALGTGTWGSAAVVSGFIYVLNTTGNVIQCINANTLADVNTGDLTIGGSADLVSMASFTDDRLVILDNTNNTLLVYSVNLTTGALTAQTAENIDLSADTWSFVGTDPSLSDVNHQGSSNHYIFVVNSSNEATTYNAATRQIVSKFAFTLPAAYQGAAPNDSVNSMFFLDDTANSIRSLNLSRLLLPSAVFGAQRIAAIWVPTGVGDARRYRIHVAYRTTFQSTPLSSIDWLAAGFKPQSGQSRMVFIENQTHGGNAYAVYAEESVDGNRPGSHYAGYMTISMRFGDEGYIERDGSYSAYLARTAGLYNVFDVGRGYEEARIIKKRDLFFPFEYLPASTVTSATTGIVGGLTWDGDSLLVLDAANAAVLGFTNRVRDESKDILQSVLRSANASISGYGLTWDGESVLIADRASDTVWGFTNGARDNSKDIPQSVLRSANSSIEPHGLVWDGESVLILDNQARAVWGFTNGVRDSAKDISSTVLNPVGANLFGIAWDGESVLIIGSTNDAVFGFTNGARDESKDISSGVTRLLMPTNNLNPQGMVWGGGGLYILDATRAVIVLVEI